MDVKETSKEEPKEEPEEEPKEEINKESSTEEAKKNETIKETKNPKTGDSITKLFIISIIAVIGIAFTINSIKKQNK